MKQCKDDSCISRKTLQHELSLMIGVHVDHTIVSVEEDMICDEFFDNLKQRLPVKNMGELEITLVARSCVTGIIMESSR